MLPTRGPQAYGSFTKALSQHHGYIHISQILDEGLINSRTAQQHHPQEKGTQQG